MTSLNPGSDLKAQVLQATNIVELIGQTVALKKRGANYTGLCPFHQEKTPSFSVNPARQFFHCFGCKESGNAIDFVMKRDRVEFMDALKVLADRAGIQMPRRGQDAARTTERQQLFEAQAAACAFFEKQLAHAEIGAAARAYLEKRGFTPETVRQFHVGLAPESWDALLKHLTGRKFQPDLLARAGLVKARQTGPGFYDTFRNRIMFPIFDESHSEPLLTRIAAFGGRAMPGSQDPAKYLNSPETPLFSKGRTVYGLNFARERMQKTGTAVVVEGYTDVVIAHQFGASNVVSVLGTALTEQHVTTLRRFAGKIVLLFDADEAGGRAADRAVELFLTQDVEIAIASMPEGMDPDEYFLKFGAEVFERDVVAAAKDVLSYKWDQLARQFKASGGEITRQQEAVKAYLELLAQARGSGPVDPLRWGAALARVSRLTEMSIDDLHRQFRKPAATARRMVTTPPTGPGGHGRVPVGRGGAGMPGGTDVRPGHDGQAPATDPGAEGVGESAPGQSGWAAEPVSPARELAERQILGILLREPRRWEAVQLAVHVEDFAAGARRALAEIYWQHQRDEGEPVFSEFLGVLGPPALKALAVELLESVEEFGAEQTEQTLDGALAFFEDERRRRAEQKQVAELRRISQQSVGPEAVAQQFEQFVKNNRAADPRRLGPIRRSGSGS